MINRRYYKSLLYILVKSPITICGVITMDAICLTRREKRCKILKKFKFWEYRQLKNENFNYRCTNKLCNASIIVNNNDQIVDQSNAEHKQHDAYSDQVISR